MRVLALVLIGCVSLALRPAVSDVASAGVSLTPQEERDSYAIYSMLLSQDPERTVSQVLGIQNETRLRQLLGADEPRPQLPVAAPAQRATYQPVIEDFKRRNLQSMTLEPKFDIDRYTLLTTHEAEEVAALNPTIPPPPPTPGVAPSPAPQEDPRIKGIRRVYFFSAVGFSADGRRALVYVATWFHGRFYFVQKKHGKWVLDDNYQGDVREWWI